MLEQNNHKRQPPAAPLRAYRELYTLAKQELQLYRKYADLLERERSLSLGNDVAGFETVQSSRALVTDQLLQQKALRDRWRAVWANDLRGSLTEWVELTAPTAEKERVVSALKELKSLVNSSRMTNQEYQSLLSFQLKMVGGCLSLLWSATQDVVRSYSRLGKIKEKTSPPTAARSRGLGQA